VPYKWHFIGYGWDIDYLHNTIINHKTYYHDLVYSLFSIARMDGCISQQLYQAL
jgi:hypothetical protein